MTKQTPTRSNLPVLVAETPLTPQPPALILFGRDGGKFRAAWFEAADLEPAQAAAVTMQLRALSPSDDAARSLARLLPRGRILPSGRAHVPFAKRDLYARVADLAGAEVGPSIPAGGLGDRPDGTDAVDTSTEAASGAVEASGDAAQTPTTAASATVGTGMNGSRPSDAGASADDGSKDGRQAAGPSPAPRPGAHLFVGESRPSDRGQIGLGSVVLAQEGPDEGWWEAEVIGANGRTFSLRWRDYPTQPTILRKASELALPPPGEP